MASSLWLWTCGAGPAGCRVTRTIWRPGWPGTGSGWPPGVSRSVLHPVLTQFQELIDSDPVVRMYLNQMIAQVPRAKQYRKRHLQSVPQMLRLINEVLTMAPEYSQDAMVVLPLGAILDWAMGTPAGFAAFRDRQINAMFKKILTAWCEFLTSSDSRYVLNDSPSGWKCNAARRAVGIDQYQYDPRRRVLGVRVVERLFHPALHRRRASGRLTGRRHGDRQRVRVNALRPGHRRPAPGPLLDQEPAVFAAGHAGQRRVGRPVRRRNRLSGFPERHQLPPVAQPGSRDDRAGLRPGRHLLLRGRLRRRRRGRAPEFAVIPGACRDAGDHPHRSRQPRHRPDGLRAQSA